LTGPPCPRTILGLPPADPYASLRFPEYRAFLAAMTSIFAATQIQSAVLGWQVYVLTGDPFALGLVGLAEAVPFLALTLVGGWAADRTDRRRISLLSFCAVGLSGLALLLLSLAPAGPVLPLYGAQMLAGVGRAFFRPASAALGTELVPRQHYQNAASWRSSFFHGAMVLGPAVGGGLIALGGPRLAYGVVVTLSAIGLVLMATIAPRPRPASAAGPIGAGLSEGIRFVFSQPILLGALTLDLFAVLFGGATALLPVFARDILGVGEVGFGFLRAAPAVGSITVALLLARFGYFSRAGRVLLWCVAGFGCTWMLFALSRSFALSLALLALGGALDGVSVILRGTLVQLWTPQAMMGRVASVNSFFIGSSNELGAFESGVAARLLGVVPSVIVGGALTLVTVGWVAWRAPALRRLRHLAPEVADVGTHAT
jgi:MFS family permease